MSTAIVGTSRAEHLARAVEIVVRGPLAAATMEGVRQAFARCGAGWPGQV